MSRPLVILLALLVVLIGGMFLLAGQATEQQPTRVEKQVDLGNLN